MVRTQFEPPWLTLFAVALTACASPAAVSSRDWADANDTGKAVGARDASEQLVLDRLPALPPGRSERVGGMQVTAELPYSAASGRICRAISWEAGPSRRAARKLACSGGGPWFFVPEVFAGGRELE